MTQQQRTVPADQVQYLHFAVQCVEIVDPLTFSAVVFDVQAQCAQQVVQMRLVMPDAILALTIGGSTSPHRNPSGLRSQPAGQGECRRESDTRHYARNDLLMCILRLVFHTCGDVVMHPPTVQVRRTPVSHGTFRPATKDTCASSTSLPKPDELIEWQ